VTAGAGNDSLIDPPTPFAEGGNGRGNYCTLTPLDATLTLSNGNLDWSAPSSVERGARGTFAVSSGKWYFEYIAKGSTFELVGWAAQAQNNNSTMPTGVGASTWAYYLFDLKTYNNATASAVYGTTASSGDIIMVALDLDNSKIYWGRNGTWFNSGNPATGTNAAYTNVSGTLFPWVQQYNQTSSINFGQRPFAYTPPSGFVALNTQNLPEPSIKKPSSYMDVKLYTGNNSTQTISGLGFSPDLVWLKSRSGAFGHGLYDTVRGATRQLCSHQTSAEVSVAGRSLTAFNSDGFSLNIDDASYGAYVNQSGQTQVAWCWDANGSGSTNNAGTITSTVSANASAGFSIITFTGNATAGATVGHGLGVAPKMVIYKARNNGNDWWTYHSGLTSAAYAIALNGTGAQNNTVNFFNSTAPSATVLTLGYWNNPTGFNLSTQNYVAYCFSEVAGFSKFGSYTGNGSSDGPYVFCGFRPRWVMIKRIDSATDWVVYDTSRDAYNQTQTRLFPNLSDAESSADQIDLLSNGFKFRFSGSLTNASGGTYIFAAFAETPFKYSLAR